MKKIKKTYLSKIKYRGGLFVTLGLLSLLIISSQIYWENLFDLAPRLIASYKIAIKDGEYWRLLTSIFIHSDLKHLLSNSYMFLLLGILNFSYFGPLLFPLLSLFFAILVNYISLLTYPPNVALLGASGWIYLLGGTWLTLFVLIEKKHPLFLRIFKAIGIALIVFFPQSYVPEVSYRTHAIGFIVGIITGISQYVIQRKKIIQFEVWETIVAPDQEIDREILYKAEMAVLQDMDNLDPNIDPDIDPDIDPEE